MADPVTLGLLTAAALAQNKMETDALSSEAREIKRNHDITQRDLGQQRYEARAAAAEQMTDRMAEAARSMSMARVLAADGLGGLEARTSNIAAGEATDLARIERGHKNQQSTISDQTLAVNRQARSAMFGVKLKSRASQVNTILKIGMAAGSAYLQGQQAAAATSTAKAGSGGMAYPRLTSLGQVKPDNFWTTTGVPKL